jgi:hypothetical protein
VWRGGVLLTVRQNGLAVARVNVRPSPKGLALRYPNVNVLSDREEGRAREGRLGVGMGRRHLARRVARRQDQLVFS